MGQTDHSESTKTNWIVVRGSCVAVRDCVCAVIAFKQCDLWPRHSAWWLVLAQCMGFPMYRVRQL